jgi:hypothetical protein
LRIEAPFLKGKGALGWDPVTPPEFGVTQVLVFGEGYLRTRFFCNLRVVRPAKIRQRAKAINRIEMPLVPPKNCWPEPVGGSNLVGWSAPPISPVGVGPPVPPPTAWVGVDCASCCPVPELGAIGVAVGVAVLSLPPDAGCWPPVTVLVAVGDPSPCAGAVAVGWAGVGVEVSVGCSSPSTRGVRVLVGILVGVRVLAGVWVLWGRPGVFVAVGGTGVRVIVAVLVAVLVGVLVRVLVAGTGVRVAVAVGVAVRVLSGRFVAVAVAVELGVSVGFAVDVLVGVLVTVTVGV